MLSYGKGFVESISSEGIRSMCKIGWSVVGLTE